MSINIRKVPVSEFKDLIYAGSHPLLSGDLTMLNTLDKLGVKHIVSLEETRSDLLSIIWKGFDLKNNHVTKVGHKDIFIEDFSAPHVNDLDILCSFLHTLLQKGDKIFIHCRGGMGRTGTVLAALYMKINKVNAPVAINYIRSIYSEYAIESHKQINVLSKYDKLLVE